MTYSPLFPQQRQPVLQPFWIATIASVAFHGLLWINIPTRSGNSRTSLNTVDLVELTPEQLERLPNLNSPSQLTLPPINPEAWQPQQPIANAPGNSSVNSSSAGNPSSFVLPPPRASLELPPPPVLQLPPISSNSPYREPLVIPTLPPPPPANPPVYDDANPLPILPPSDLDLEINRLADNPEEDIATPLPPEPLEPIGEEPPEETEPGVLPSRIPEAAIADLRRRQEKYRQQETESEDTPEPQSSPVATLPPEDEIPEPEATPEPQSSPVAALPPEDEIPESEATPEPDDPLLAEIQALREAIVYDPQGTSQEEATATLESWISNLPNRYKNNSNSSLWQQQDIEVPLPVLACRNQLQGRATIGVVVDPEGEIVQEAQLIQSTGYGILNEAALEAVRAKVFELTDDPQLYLLKITFEPLDTCG
ncbi:TonB family protein [Roseofilum sp. Guam]|uniref:energy transducer TonB n=1 Tax=Roseofilum sp. Guam TaxID=2821502 RepID=UPI001B112688|nr:TonB family protein [Roseofilum sp. Guam]MBP0030966.1 TonB family protein [Roseofilum sp. Guam]